MCTKHIRFGSSARAGWNWNSTELCTQFLSGYKYFIQVHLNDKKKKQAAELIFCGPTLKPHHWCSHPHSVCEFMSSALCSSLLPKAATSHLLGRPGQKKGKYFFWFNIIFFAGQSPQFKHNKISWAKFFVELLCALPSSYDHPSISAKGQINRMKLLN